MGPTPKAKKSAVLEPEHYTCPGQITFFSLLKFISRARGEASYQLMHVGNVFIFIHICIDRNGPFNHILTESITQSFLVEIITNSYHCLSYILFVTFLM